MSFATAGDVAKDVRVSFLLFRSRRNIAFGGIL